MRRCDGFSPSRASGNALTFVGRNQSLIPSAGLWMKADLLSCRCGRSDEFLDSREDPRELLIGFIFQRVDLVREIPIGFHQAPELYECAHDGDVDFDGTRTPQHARKHGDT